MEFFKDIAKWIVKSMALLVFIAFVSELYAFFMFTSVIDSIGVTYSQIVSKYGYLPIESEQKLAQQLNSFNRVVNGISFNRVQNVRIQVMVDNGGGQISQTRRVEPASDAEYEVSARVSGNGIMTRTDTYNFIVSYEYHFCLPNLPFGFRGRTMNPGIPKTFVYPGTCVRLIKQQQ